MARGERAGHGVAADQHGVGVRRARIGEHGLERVDVAVDVVQRQDVHGASLNGLVERGAGRNGDPLGARALDHQRARPAREVDEADVRGAGRAVQAGAEVALLLGEDARAPSQPARNASSSPAGTSNGSISTTPPSMSGAPCSRATS